MTRRFTRILAALALLVGLTIPLGMWGQTTVTQNNFTAISGNVQGDTRVSYAAYKGGGTSAPAVNGGAIRLYQNSANQTGGYVVIGAAEGYVITSATIQSTMATTTGYKLTDSDPESDTPVKTSFVVNNYSLSANTDYTVSSISTRYITFACFGTSSSSRLYLSKISVVYQSNGGSTPTTYTVTFNPGSGSCTTSELSGSMNASITLPTAAPSEACAGYGWTFAGWAKSSIAETSTAPTLYTGSFTISGDETLYAVYSLAEGEGDQTVFNFADIASANNWVSGTKYTEVEIEPITLTATGSTNTGKYYSSDETWRIYASENGTVTVTSSEGSIVAVTSNPSRTFSISNGEATFTAEGSDAKFKSITVTWGDVTYTYATSPTCVEKVADPTFSEAGGSFYPSKSIELSCETPEATILYKLSENGNWETYTSAITITSTTTIWAKATKDGMPESNVVSQTYTRLYTITVNQTQGGIISANPTHAAEGATVTLTATPSVGYTFDEWTVPASITMSGNSFQMPASDVTVSASFVASAAGTYTVSFSINDKVEMTATVDAGHSIDLTKFVAEGEGYTFEGWSTTAGGENITPQNAYTPSANITLYPGVNPAPTGDEYTLVTDVDQLVAGNLVVIAANGDKNIAMAATQGNNNRGKATIIKTGNTITFPDSPIDDNPCELTLGKIVDGANTYWTFYDANVYNHTEYQNQGYLYAASSSKNWLRTQTENDDNGKWSISVTSGGAATVTAQGSYTHNVMQYNSGSNIFSCYETASQQEVWLYTKSPSKSASGNRAVPTTSKVTAIAADVLVTVKANGIVYLTGSNAGNESNLVVEDGGQLVASANVKGTMQKTINGYTSATTSDGWYFISSPLAANVNVTDVENLVNASGTGYDLYYFKQNPTINNGVGLEWINQKNSAANFTKLFQGSGYLYANAETTTLGFAGNLRKSSDVSYDVDITYSDANPDENMRGWNLVGNPFPSNAKVSMAFYKMNSTSDGINPTAVAANSVIASTEGVFVKATEGGSNQVTFTATTDAVSGNSKGRSINIDVTRQGEFLDRAIVNINGEGSLSKLFLNNTTSKVYFRQDQKDYAIVASANENELPVSFKASRSGSYTLTVNTEDMEMNYLHLIDNMTGMDVDLLQTPSYTFNATTCDYESRFRLVFAANNEDGVSTGSTAFAFYSNGNWIINNAGEATLQVIDLTGRILSSETVNGSVSTTINAVPGVYMLRLINGENVNVQKIVVR